MLNEPLPGEAHKEPSPFTEEEEAQSFMAAMSQLKPEKAGA